MKRAVYEMKTIETVKLVKVESDKRTEMEDVVIAEYPLTIFLNGDEFITLLCSPNSLQYLVYGFLKSEGIIMKREDVESVIIDEDKGFAHVSLHRRNPLSEELFGRRTMTTGCAKGVTFYNVTDTIQLRSLENSFTVSLNSIWDMLKRLNSESELFKLTGGVHSCSLCSCNDILIMMEDVGRHNALDKILGEALVEGVDLSDKMILTSGRISSEMLIKTAKAGIQVIASRSAPTALAVKQARELNMTLIGFARGARANIYTGDHRISNS